MRPHKVHVTFSFASREEAEIFGKLSFEQYNPQRDVNLSRILVTDESQRGVIERDIFYNLRDET